MRKLLVCAAFFMCLSSPAYALRGGAIAFSSTTSLEEIVEINGNPRKNGEMYKGTVEVKGTFNSNTLHLLVSTDGGATKVPDNDLTGTAYTISSAGTFPIEWGWPTKGTESTIFYLSVGSDSTLAPSITVTVDDNR